jgi:predicted lipoprotein
MRKSVLTILSLSLIAVSTAQVAARAAGHAEELIRVRVPASQQFRNANASLTLRSAEQHDWSNYSEGRVISAPAGQ